MRLLSSFLALALSTSTALAAAAVPLSPGKPAGVKQAQDRGDTPLYVLAGGAVLIAIAVGISNHNNGAPAGGGSTVTTGTTG
jgi:hypothetical protein